MPQPTRDDQYNRHMMIESYVKKLDRKLRENIDKIPVDVYGNDYHIICWMAAQITCVDDWPSVQKVGARIKRDLVYYELSL